MSKDIGLIYCSEMIQAFLDHRKTMTRRTQGLKVINENPYNWGEVVDLRNGWWRFWNAEGIRFIEIKCPYAVGDRIYAKQKLPEIYESQIPKHTDIVYGLTDDRIYGILTSLEVSNGRYNSIEWNPVEVNSYIAKRGLHGGVGWADLLTNKIQWLWSQGFRGLVSAQSSERNGSLQVRSSILPSCFAVPSEPQNNKTGASLSLYGISRNAALSIRSGAPSRRQHSEQSTIKYDMGDTRGKLVRQKSSRSCKRGGKPLEFETDGFRESGFEVGNREGFSQPTSGSENTWDVAGWHLLHSSPLITWRSSRIYAKETWATEKLFDHLKPSEIPEDADIWFKPKLKGARNMGRWRSSMFMPKWAARIWREIVGIRCERLQAITEEDAIAEGVQALAWHPELHLNDGMPYRLGFHLLWDRLNGKKYPWASNPWVWVLSLKEEAK